MNEPANHTAWVGASGAIWVRVDEASPTGYHWWSVTGGIVGPRGRSWAEIMPAGSYGMYGLLTEADPARTARALARVRQEAGR